MYCMCMIRDEDEDWDDDTLIINVDTDSNRNFLVFTRFLYPKQNIKASLFVLLRDSRSTRTHVNPEIRA